MASRRSAKKADMYTGQLSYFWKLKEKEDLLKALRSNPEATYADLHRLIPTKSSQEIEWFINVIKQRAFRRPLTNADTATDAPIVVWLMQIEDLLQKEEDHSTILSKVMSIAGNLEPHNRPSKNKSPDYSAIYNYLAAALRGEIPPDLSPLDSAVVLDLLQNLADTLKSIDVSEQQRLLQAKYKLLRAKVEPNKRDDTIRRVQKALEVEDLEELEAECLRMEQLTGEGQGHPNGESSASQSQPSASASQSEQIPTQVDQSNSSPDIRSPGRSDSTPGTSANQQQSANKKSSGSSQSESATPSTSTNPLDISPQPSDNFIHPRNRYPAKRLPSKKRLHSLNPFCIAPKYLRPKKKARLQ